MRALWQFRRVLIPVVLGVLGLLATSLLPPFAAYVALMCSVALFFDAGLALMPTTGGLNQHRQ